MSPHVQTPRATFCPDAVEVDPQAFADYVLSDELASDKLPEMATAFHPANHPQVKATLDWASREGQAILVGNHSGDFDVMTSQVHLNLEAPMLGERFAPYGHLHLMLHDLTHHYLGQVRVRPEDVTPERIEETRKRIHQAAMLGEVVASFATVSRIIPGYSNYRARTLGEGREDQFGGFWSFADSEREVVEGWKAFYTGGEVLHDYLRRELDEAQILEHRRAGNWLVWPSFALLLGSRRWPKLVKAKLEDWIHRFEAKLARRLFPRLFTWAYWNRSVYSVADFQKDCRHLADRYTSAWHIQWQADFDEGYAFDEVVERCHSALRGLIQRDYDFFERSPNTIGERGYAANVRRQQIRMLARKTYELAARLDEPGFVRDSLRAEWRARLARANAVFRQLFRELDADNALARYEDEFLPLRAELCAAFERDIAHFALAPERADALRNPARAFEDPGVRDANSKPSAPRTLRERWSAFKAQLAKLVGRRVVPAERAWIQEIYAELDHEALFDEAEAQGIPTVGRDQAPPPLAATPPVRVRRGPRGFFDSCAA